MAAVKAVAGAHAAIRDGAPPLQQLSAEQLQVMLSRLHFELQGAEEKLMMLRSAAAGRGGSMQRGY